MPKQRTLPRKTGAQRRKAGNTNENTLPEKEIDKRTTGLIGGYRSAIQHPIIQGIRAHNIGARKVVLLEYADGCIKSKRANLVILNSMSIHAPKACHKRK